MFRNFCNLVRDQPKFNQSLEVVCIRGCKSSNSQYQNTVLQKRLSEIVNFFYFLFPLDKRIVISIIYIICIQQLLYVMIYLSENRINYFFFQLTCEIFTFEFDNDRQVNWNFLATLTRCIPYM